MIFYKKKKQYLFPELILSMSNSFVASLFFNLGDEMTHLEGARASFIEE